MSILDAVFNRNGHQTDANRDTPTVVESSADSCLILASPEFQPGMKPGNFRQQSAPTDGRQADVGWNYTPLSPPVPHDVAGELPGLLKDLQTLLEYRFQGWHIGWIYQTQVAPATAERDTLRQQAAKRLAELNDQRAKQRTALAEEIKAEKDRQRQLEDELDGAQAAFAAATAEAQLVCDPTPQSLTAAVERQRPNHIQVAGAAGVQGLSPLHVAAGWWDWTHVVGVMVGLVLGLCLATVIGMFHLADLLRREGLFKLAVAWAVGYAVVWMLGEFASYVTTAFTRWLEPRNEENVPTFRSPGRVALAFGIAGVALGVAEVFVEAHGIMALHAEQNALASGFKPLPFVVYLLFGTLATGTFLAFKIGRCWTTADRELRRCWMHHRERQWGQDTCGARAVQEAFRQCHRIARVKERLSDTRGRIRPLVDEEATLEPLTECDEPLRERLGKAEIAAVAATDQFHGFVRALLQTVGPPVPPAPTREETSPGGDT